MTDLIQVMVLKVQEVTTKTTPTMMKMVVEAEKAAKQATILILITK